MNLHRWIFPAKVIRVIDGDTLDVMIDVGFRIQRKDRIRLLGVDAPEARGPERARGQMATAWVEQWVWDDIPIDKEWPFLLQTEKDPDSFGRYLGRLYRRHDERCLNDDLIESGHAEVWGER